MKLAALLLLAGCSKIFGLSPPRLAADARAADADADASADALDAQLDIPDAASGHCAAIADCPTSVCLPSTLCAADTDVAWLDPAGSLNAMCTMAMPCNGLAGALATARPYIRVHGTITNLSTVNQNVAIFGEPGAGFTGSLQINGGTVGLADLDLTGGATCLQTMAGSVIAEHIVIHDCTNYGINANGALTLDGSTIASNRNGGVRIFAAPFSITNNFIYKNGLSGGFGGSTGGLAISASTALGSRIELNTIVGNGVKSNNSAGGLYCNIAGFAANGNVIAANLGNGSPNVSYANTGGACTHTASVIATTVTMLGFVDLTTDNYHLTAASQLIDDPMLATTLTTDVDGEARPFGSAYDVGADEYHP